MNRPDLDAIEAADRRIGNIRNGDLEEVIAYARHLEKEVGAYQDQAYSDSLAHNRYEARISELEAALEPFSQAEKLGHVPAGLGFLLNNAARVLRKGE